MAIPPDLAHESNDRLLIILLHISGVAPLYRWQHARRAMELTSAILYLDAVRMPDLTADQIGAAIEWAADKCGIEREQITVQPMPGGAPTEPMADGEPPFTAVPRLRRLGGLEGGDYMYGNTDD